MPHSPVLAVVAQDVNRRHRVVVPMFKMFHVVEIILHAVEFESKRVMSTNMCK